MNLALSVYSKCRTQIMGFAAIMIILCHIRGINYSNFPFLEKLLWFGNYGVELFLFVSGIGMYHSLSKENISLIQWYNRRYVRITIPFLLIAISIYPLRIVLNIPASLSDFLLYITTLEFWFHHKGAWYVAMLFPLYFLTPYIVKFANTSKAKVITVSVLIILLLGFSYIPLGNDIVRNIQFVTLRVPIFILGIIIAPYVKNGYRINTFSMCFIVLVGLLLWHFCSFSLGGGLAIICLLGTIIAFICKCKFINKILLFMGKMSLESYLTNIYLGHIIMTSDAITLSGGVKSLIVIVIGILTAYIFHKLSNKKISKIE